MLAVARLRWDVGTYKMPVSPYIHGFDVLAVARVRWGVGTVKMPVSLYIHGFDVLVVARLRWVVGTIVLLYIHGLAVLAVTRSRSHVGKRYIHVSCRSGGKFVLKQLKLPISRRPVLPQLAVKMLLFSQWLVFRL